MATGHGDQRGQKWPTHKRVRLKNYDYSSPGGYFVTICTHDRQPLFGDIHRGMMGLNAYGSAIWTVWSELPDWFPSLQGDWFVVMPNHVHAVIVLTSPVSPFVGPGLDPGRLSPSPFVGPGLDPGRLSLGRIVGAMKSLGLREVNQVRGPGASIWQERFYDHVVRDEDELRRIRKYIYENPLKWEFDRNNPSCAEPLPLEPWEEGYEQGRGE